MCSCTVLNKRFGGNGWLPKMGRCEPQEPHRPPVPSLFQMTSPTTTDPTSRMSADMSAARGNVREAVVGVLVDVAVTSPSFRPGARTREHSSSAGRMLLRNSRFPATLPRLHPFPPYSALFQYGGDVTISPMLESGANARFPTVTDPNVEVTRGERLPVPFADALSENGVLLDGDGFAVEFKRYVGGGTYSSEWVEDCLADEAGHLDQTPRIVGGKIAGCSLSEVRDRPDRLGVLAPLLLSEATGFLMFAVWSSHVTHPVPRFEGDAHHRA